MNIMKWIIALVAVAILAAACSADDQLLPQTYPRGVDAGPSLGQLLHYPADGGVVP